MILQINDFKEGAHGVVALVSEHNLAYKIFKSYKHPNTDKNSYTEGQFNDYKRKVFESEKNAYELISASDIKCYFPLHYNQTIEKVIDDKGVDVSDKFLLDCCLTLDLIVGHCKKNAELEIIAHCKEKNIDLLDIFRNLRSIGVRYFIDSSVFCLSDGIKIIDIATTDSEEFRPPEETPWA